MSKNIEMVSLEMWAQAFLIRAFEQRLLKLFSQGELFGTVHTCVGQEFSGIAAARHLLEGDLIVSNHRCHGHYLARTGDVAGLMAEVMGRVTGICGGRGGSQHICSKGFFSNGVQGGMLPVAAGMALAQRLTGANDITVAFIGDGTLGEGIVYETMNIASKWQLPLVIVAECNGVAQSTPQSQTLAGDIVKRAEAFGITSYHGSTASPLELTDLMGIAVQKARKEHVSVFVRVDTHRLMAHSKGDDDRPREELERYWSVDALSNFEAEHPGDARQLESRSEELVSEAVAAAQAAPFAAVEMHQRAERQTSEWVKTDFPGKERVVSRIHEALRDHLSNDHRGFLLGEDIEGPYGGAFKVTKNLSNEFPGRVRNTPISEAAIVGLANGLALRGLRPVCEIMFGDFLTLAADQLINHASKFRWMFNDQVTVPVVVRTPMGGKRGYGATHSQSLEKHFLGLPGTRVLALHNRYDPRALYQSVFQTANDPTLVIENKTLYGDYVQELAIPGFWCEHTNEPFPTTRIRSDAIPDITIVCYGGMLVDVEKAIDRLFEEHEIVSEVICPTQLYPLTIQPVLDSVRVTGMLLVVEEGQLFCGFGAEVLAAVHEACPGEAILTRRLGAASNPLPCCKSAEIESLPGIHSIVQTAIEMVSNA